MDQRESNSVSITLVFLVPLLQYQKRVSYFSFIFIKSVFHCFHLIIACVILQVFVYKVNFEVASKLSLDIAQLRPVWLSSFCPKSKTAWQWVSGPRHIHPQRFPNSFKQSFFFARSCLGDKYGQTAIKIPSVSTQQFLHKHSKHVDHRLSCWWFQHPSLNFDQEVIT